MTNPRYISPAEAASWLNRQIVAMHGSAPEVIDRLDFITKRVPLGDTGRIVDVTIALPTGQSATNENVCAAASGYFNDWRSS